MYSDSFSVLPPHHFTNPRHLKHEHPVPAIIGNSKSHTVSSPLDPVNGFPSNGRNTSSNKLFTSSNRAANINNRLTAQQESSVPSENNTMVSESVLRNGPSSLTNHVNSVSHTYNSHNNTNSSNSDTMHFSSTRVCLSPSSTTSSPRGVPHPKVCGVLLASERLSTCRSGTCEKACQAKCHRSSILLGSVLLEKEISTCDELRRILISQLTTIPKHFAFLSKDGYVFTLLHQPGYVMPLYFPHFLFYFMGRLWQLAYPRDAGTQTVVF